MTRRNRSETEYHNVAGIKIFLHKPADADAFIRDCCEYDGEPIDLDEYGPNERGELGERAAVNYAEAQGYKDIHPAEVDSADKGVDVVGVDPETKEVVVIEAKTKTSSDRFTKSDLGTTEQKGGGTRQLTDSYIWADNIEKLEKADSGDSGGASDKIMESIHQTWGEVRGYRKEFVGVQVGEPEGGPISGTLDDVGIERAHVTQLPASTGEQESQVDDGVADKPWGSDHEGFEVQNKAESSLPDEVEEAWDALTDKNGELKNYGVIPSELQGETGPTRPEDWDDSGPSEFEDVDGIGRGKAENLKQEGYENWEDIAQSEEGDLQDVDGVNETLGDRLRTAADRRQSEEDCSSDTGRGSVKGNGEIDTETTQGGTTDTDIEDADETRASDAGTTPTSDSSEQGGDTITTTAVSNDAADTDDETAHRHINEDGYHDRDSQPEGNETRDADPASDDTVRTVRDTENPKANTEAASENDQGADSQVDSPTTDAQEDVDEQSSKSDAQTFLDDLKSGSNAVTDEEVEAVDASETETDYSL